MEDELYPSDEEDVDQQELEVALYSQIHFDPVVNDNVLQQGSYAMKPADDVQHFVRPRFKIGVKSYTTKKRELKQPTNLNLDFISFSKTDSSSSNVQVEANRLSVSSEKDTKEKDKILIESDAKDKRLKKMKEKIKSRKHKKKQSSHSTDKSVIDVIDCDESSSDEEPFVGGLLPFTITKAKKTSEIEDDNMKSTESQKEIANPSNKNKTKKVSSDKTLPFIVTKAAKSDENQPSTSGLNQLKGKLDKLEDFIKLTTPKSVTEKPSKTKKLHKRLKKTKFSAVVVKYHQDTDSEDSDSTSTGETPKTTTAVVNAGKGKEVPSTCTVERIKPLVSSSQVTVLVDTSDSSDDDVVIVHDKHVQKTVVEVSSESESDNENDNNDESSGDEEEGGGEEDVADKKEEDDSSQNSSSEDDESHLDASGLDFNLTGGVQSLLKADSSQVVDPKWNIDVQDRFGSNKSITNRYFNPRTIKCYNCNEEGHLAAACTKERKVKCILCSLDGHHMSKCPNSVCFNCLCPGHRAADCPQPRLNRSRNCGRCWMPGHVEKACPDLWRQFHLTTGVDSKRITKPKPEPDPKAILYCYNCGKEGHLGYECYEERFCRFNLPLYPFIAEYDKRIEFNTMTDEEDSNERNSKRRRADDRERDDDDSRKKGKKGWRDDSDREYRDHKSKRDRSGHDSKDKSDNTKGRSEKQKDLREEILGRKRKMDSLEVPVGTEREEISKKSKMSERTEKDIENNAENTINKEKKRKRKKNKLSRVEKDKSDNSEKSKTGDVDEPKKSKVKASDKDDQTSSDFSVKSVKKKKKEKGKKTKNRSEGTGKKQTCDLSEDSQDVKTGESLEEGEIESGDSGMEKKGRRSRSGSVDCKLKGKHAASTSGDSVSDRRVIVLDSGGGLNKNKHGKVMKNNAKNNKTELSSDLWWTEEVQYAVNARKEAKRVWNRNRTETSKVSLRQANKFAKRVIADAKKDALKGRELQQDNQAVNHSGIFSLNISFGNHQESSNPIQTSFTANQPNITEESNTEFNVKDTFISGNTRFIYQQPTDMKFSSNSHSSNYSASHSTNRADNLNNFQNSVDLDLNIRTLIKGVRGGNRFERDRRDYEVDEEEMEQAEEEWSNRSSGMKSRKGKQKERKRWGAHDELMEDFNSHQVADNEWWKEDGELSDEEIRSMMYSKSKRKRNMKGNQQLQTNFSRNNHQKSNPKPNEDYLPLPSSSGYQTPRRFDRYHYQKPHQHSNSNKNRPRGNFQEDYISLPKSSKSKPNKKFKGRRW